MATNRNVVQEVVVVHSSAETGVQNAHRKAHRQELLEALVKLEREVKAVDALLRYHTSSMVHSARQVLHAALWVVMCIHHLK